jgi:ATP-binding cassette subfamily C protein CydD
LSTGLSILILAPEFFQPLRNLSQYYHDRASALGAANNLVERLGIDERAFRLSKLAKDEQVETSSQVTKQLTTSKENQKARLTLTNLSVGYCQSAPLLKQINLKLSTGDTLVITGQSGSGKSSLLNTIAGYLPAMDGSIVYQLSVKPSMSYLPQSAWIKNASIYENLIVLAPNATHSEMLKVLEQLGLAEELDLKHNGLDTLLGEHGQGLSGGQMQRIALARVLLNPAPVVLLDEPTAKLDEDSKLLVINALLMLKTKVIMLISSHDPAVMAIGDNSIDLNGRAKII